MEELTGLTFDSLSQRAPTPEPSKVNHSVCVRSTQNEPPGRGSRRAGFTPKERRPQNRANERKGTDPQTGLLNVKCETASLLPWVAGSLSLPGPGPGRCSCVVPGPSLGAFALFLVPGGGARTDPFLGCRRGCSPRKTQFRTGIPLLWCRLPSPLTQPNSDGRADVPGHV